MLACRLKNLPGLTYPLKVQRYHQRAPAPVSQEVSQLLANYSSHPPRPLNLSTLLSFGRPLTPESVLASVSYALSELPRRLATRVRSLEALPFIVGTNPYVASTLNAYRDSFRWLAAYPPIHTLEENAKFASQLEGLVQSHANDIPTMAKGFQECSRYMSPTQVSNFLDGAIRNRIAVRLIAEQHIALSQALNSPEQNSTCTGVVNRVCSPREMIRMCSSYVSDLCEATLGASPPILIDGHVDATFPYIPVHLEYMLTEILKNSFRATVEHHQKRYRSSPLPPVRITISPPHGLLGSMSGTSFLSLRIRDQGGGVSPSNMARIFSYAFTTAGRGAEDDGGGPYAAQHVGGSAAIGAGDSGETLFGEITGKGLQTGIGTIAGLGYGLPMSRLYAKYFGGSLDLMSLDGWGSDVFLKLRCLDEVNDGAV
jgi:26S proteasome regulatory subunit T1